MYSACAGSQEPEKPIEKPKTENSTPRLHVVDDKTVILCKAVLCGDPGVGKTALFTRLMHGTWQGNSMMCTVGVEFSLKTVVVNGVTFKLQLVFLELPFFNFFSGVRINCSFFTVL